MRKSQIKILIILTVVLAAVVCYALVPTGDDEEPLIKKIGLGMFKTTADNNDTTTIAALSDSIKTATVAVQEVDTTKQNILLLGDSMVEGLSRPFADYCAANGHEYNSVCWYSSTSKTWAKTDTLAYFLNKFNPTMVLVSLGGNEQFVRDLDDRERYVKKIIDVIGPDRKLVWIGTPSWKDDTGINEINRRNAGDDRYFNSKRLNISRAKDHIHPTSAGSVAWMDSIATWMGSFDYRHPIVMKKYSEKAGSKHLVLLQPMDI